MRNFYPRPRQMEDLAELQAKLHRAQAAVDRGIAHLAEQRALISLKLAAGAQLAEFRNLLDALEDTLRLHIQNRDRLRRQLDSLEGKKPWP
jgi:hypothetical protein